MSKTSVFCIATSLDQADQLVERLKTVSFSNKSISALFADKNTNRDFAHMNETKAPERAATGTGVGQALGWIAGIGALAIPGAGPFCGRTDYDRLERCDRRHRRWIDSPGPS